MQLHFDGCSRCSDTVGLLMCAFDDDERSRTNGGAPDTLQLTPGQAEPFAGRYQIQKCVGLGAGGTVYAAHDPVLERVVALKILRGSNETTAGESGSSRLSGGASPGAGASGGSAGRESKWTREAKTMAKVVHPNVVAVHDVGVADDHVFIATEFVEGGSLDDWLSERERSWPEVLAIFVKAGEGLAAIHERGLVHRDFKPHNVLVGADGRPRVTDFGLARLLPELDEETRQAAPTMDGVLSKVEIAETLLTCTRTGMLVGTPAYMSPEQWRGTAADARSDQFSFCVALYQGLWGQRAFTGDSAVVLSGNVFSGRVAPVNASRNVPAWLERVVMRGLCVAPEDRFESVDALLGALREGPLRVRRRRLGAAAGLGAALVGGLGYAAASLPQEQCTPEDARFDGLWDASVRSTIRGRWTDPSLGAAVADRVDTWVEQWQQTQLESCRAAQGDAAASVFEHELQQACLDRHLGQLRAATTVLETVDAMHALDVVETAGVPTRCADATALARIEPSWGSASARALSVELASDIARTDALLAAGEYDTALTLALDMQTRIGDDADPAVRASVLLEVGYAQGQLKEGKAARAALLDAVWAAEASGHVAVAASAWIELVEVEGSLLDDYDAAARAAARADPVVHRMDDPALRIMLGSARGMLESLQGNYDAALELDREVLAAAIELFGERDLQVARIHSNVAAVLNHLGRQPEAIEHAKTAVSIVESETSTTYPELALILNTLGGLQHVLGDNVAARASFTRALEIAATAWPSGDNAVSIIIEGNLAQVELAENDIDAAIARQTRILQLRREQDSAHFDVAMALHNLASMHQAADHDERAVELFREALQERIATAGPDHPQTAGTMHGLGMSLWHVKDYPAAIEMLGKAKDIRDRHNVDPYRRATTRYMLARAYSDSGNPQKALALVKEGVELLRGLPHHADALASFEAWVKKHEAQSG